MIKLIQLNIWQGRILAHVERLLKNEQPDIVCLQEVYSSKERVPNWDCFSSLETLQQALPHLKYWFFAPLFSFSVHGRRVTQGNTIGSRFPISKEVIEFTNGAYVEDLDPTPNTRNFQSCEVTIDETHKLSLINHHAYWDKNPAGTPDSVQAMQKVKNAAMRLPKPIIVCGDMNVRPETETMQLFNGLLENLTAAHKLESTLSVVARAFDNNNMVACDHVLVSPEVQVERFYASEEIVSDHKALVLEFALK